MATPPPRNNEPRRESRGPYSSTRCYCALLLGGGVSGEAGFAGAGVAGEGFVAGGAIWVAAGGRISLEAVLVPFCPG